MSKIDLMQKTAEKMVKPGKDLKLLRKYLGNDEVDGWEQDWATGKDSPDASSLKESKGKQKGLRNRGY